MRSAACPLVALATELKQQFCIDSWVNKTVANVKGVCVCVCVR